MKNSIPFSLNYNALKMFGRQLYSNAWAAISELVANGFDAEASKVYLYINMIDKEHSTIELLDNGSGMDERELRNKYVIIGRNRRLSNPKDTATGRKGIGKLAALYLSDNYNIIAKKDSDITAWAVDISNMDDLSIPSLEEIDTMSIKVTCADIWNGTEFENGTLIQLLDVNLRRLGDAAIDALEHKLSNYFLFDSMEKKLKVCIIKKATDELVFKDVYKSIAFDNMSHIYCSEDTYIDSTKDSFEVNYNNKLSTNKTQLFKRKKQNFPAEVTNRGLKEKVSIKGIKEFYGKEKEYVLTGWIGIHSSIDSQTSKKNDKRYIKNQFYNPNQIRVYVRNKLANENILGKLDLVGTYANYLEGEVSFEILDDDDFDDIATSNRQEFSIIDERVTLLISLLRGIASQLVARRQELADKVNEIKNAEDEQIRAKEKSTFEQELHDDLISASVPVDIANDVSPIIANKLKGQYELKTSYKLFISHAKKDRMFTDFISHYLQHRGFKWTDDYTTTDIFYSSDGLDITGLTPLSNMIREMILNHNTDILFFTSQNFLKSQFCLFEGGAAWATRAIVDYSIISVDYGCIPVFLTNGKPEFAFDIKDRSSFELNEQNYNNILKILNRLIRHLNNNRRLYEEQEVEEIVEASFKDKVQMKKEGKNLRDYMDNDVYEYWNTYIMDMIDNYIIEQQL
ncbi:ATP-binding protein [Acetobacterium tundrae]|uniref:TIR domain-containing protein n=1 Tax=Acetobacterium tundrae TaxID=132932 RepID=A0ABR6WI77_9FIRM|nr:ATP-binding protein [Acetobacterium tundrae]MBC3795988.1 hypothetical protein [Acetobacterium tundrae]